jgi:hypothetical protein
MTTNRIETRLSEDGSLIIPKDRVKELGLRPGARVNVIIESEELDVAFLPDSQSELRAITAQLFEEADATSRQPGKPLSDAYEAEWGAGVEEKYRRMGISI